MQREAMGQGNRVTYREESSNVVGDEAGPGRGRAVEAAVVNTLPMLLLTVLCEREASISEARWRAGK